MTFSNRYGYNPHQPKEPILEDAPEWLRVDYINKILDYLTFVDCDSRYVSKDRRPLGIKTLHEDFCVLIREETDPSYYDSWHCWEELKSHLCNCPWYEFYDFIELTGRQLKEVEERNAFDDDWNACYGFEAYRQSVNELFAKNQVAWRLDPASQLNRSVPQILTKNVDQAESELQDGFEPAREHYRKSHRFLFEHPVDPENSIKEIVSAVESVARTLFPKANTLGAAIKEMQRTQFCSPMLLSMIEKFYGYASSEPAVRHGAAVSSRVERIDAELCFHTAIAIIRYLIERQRMIDDPGSTAERI